MIVGWRRHILEGGTIVLSILLALFFDAAWDDYQDRVREGEYLQGLKAEFLAGRDEIQADQRRREAIRDLAGGLLEAAREGRRPELAPGDLVLLMDYRFYTPSHAFLEDLVSSGSLNLLRSRRLRMELLNYIQERDRLVVAETREREFVADQLEPRVARSVPLFRVLNESDTSDSSLDGLWQDEEFANLVWIRWGRTDTSMRFAQVVQRSIERVLVEIDGELE